MAKGRNWEYLQELGVGLGFSLGYGGSGVEGCGTLFEKLIISVSIVPRTDSQYIISIFHQQKMCFST